MVDPEWQRHGIGRALVTAALQVAWDDGQRTIMLETHRAWLAALRLYESLGFDEVGGQKRAGPGRM
ncbi:MAG: GNAT family N-acetyltransferase [Planctomycetes bacterium]|nr:GNAT family N-acetyltransferase [Planctomycetota bacterium]